MDKFLFKSVNELVSYLYHKHSSFKNLSHLKLQKTLYFLFAFYGGNVGLVTDEDIEKSDLSNSFPKYLFPERFEAWKYGPVIRDVYDNYKNGMCIEIPYQDNNVGEEILDFVNDLFLQIVSISEFSLVQRSRMDKEWRRKYDKKSPYRSEAMDRDKIIAEYIG